MYGKELILDIAECDVSRFNRIDIRKFMRILCDDVINMQRALLVFWDDENTAANERQTNPKTKGTTAVQFILTSNVTIHTLDILRTVYLNIFSCKYFDDDAATRFCVTYFNGKLMKRTCIERE
jgi:S-adenosylmethionine/arginine decarboxylase-like enzyme